MAETPNIWQPAFIGLLITVIVGIAGGIGSIISFTVWLIRMEARIANVLERTAKSEKETAEIWQAVQEHKDKPDLHFNMAVARQVEANHNARFGRLESDITGLGNRLDAAMVEIKQMLRDRNERADH